MFQPNVAEGVHRVFDAFVNWYLVEDGGRLTIVDAGTPRSWKLLNQALAQLGKTPQDVEAIVLTHGHYDHVGFAEKARRAETEADTVLSGHGDPWTGGARRAAELARIAGTA